MFLLSVTVNDPAWLGQGLPFLGMRRGNGRLPLLSHQSSRMFEMRLSCSQKRQSPGCALFSPDSHEAARHGHHPEALAAQCGLRGCGAGATLLRLWYRCLGVYTTAPSFVCEGGTKISRPRTHSSFFFLAY